jgi:hypothetical protein
MAAIPSVVAAAITVIVILFQGLAFKLPFYVLYWLALSVIGTAIVSFVLFITIMIYVPNNARNLSECIRKTPHTRIRKAPGSRLLAIVDFLFSPATIEETFKPTVADWHEEYFEALKQKRFMKARWINVRYTYRFIQTMGLSKVFSVIKSFKSVIK